MAQVPELWCPWFTPEAPSPFYRGDQHGAGQGAGASYILAGWTKHHHRALGYLYPEGDHGGTVPQSPQSGPKTLGQRPPPNRWVCSGRGQYSGQTEPPSRGKGAMDRVA